MKPESFPKYDAVFYDFDGTLGDSVPIILKCFHLAYERIFGECRRTDDDFMTYIGKPLETTFEMHDPATAKALTEAYLDINQRMLEDDAIQLFDGVEEDLRYLKSIGIRQGIITSKRKVSCMTTVKLRGIEDIFDAFVFMEDSKRHKPDGEPLEVASRKLGTVPERVIYVGDALPDMLCARNAGSAFALVDWTKMPRAEMEKDPQTRVIRSIRELSCIITGGEL